MQDPNDAWKTFLKYPFTLQNILDQCKTQKICAFLSDQYKTQDICEKCIEMISFMFEYVLYCYMKLQEMWCEDLENDYEFAGWYNSYKKHNPWKKQIIIC